MLKKLKKRLVSRALPLFLAALMVLPSAPLTGISAGEDAGKELTQNSNSLVYDYDTLKLTVDGEQTKELSIFSYEKIEVGSVGITENATYQWQIKHPEKNNLWVDIYDAKSENIGVSVALINNMLAEDGTAKIRLRAYTEDYAYLSNTLTVSVKDEQPSEPTLSVDKITFPHAMAGETSETPEFVTVTINYVRYDYKRDAQHKLVKDEHGNLILDEGEIAFTPYIATLVYTHPLNDEIEFPTIVGYNAYWEDENTPSLGHTLNISSVTSNITYTVSYKPKEVKYAVRYFLQNIYDDKYAEKETMSDLMGYTGAEPPEAILGKEFAGFTSLYHQPDAIAADGSTVFEVYYERNYYLMEFDCNGGYGTSTLYIRYGSYIAIPDPVRMGYVFDYWNIITKDNVNIEDAVEDEKDTIPATMPPYNSAYEAVWTTAETTYSIVYWINNDDGTKTYIGSRPVSANSADVVSGSNDLTASTNLCGLEAHTHTSCAYGCGKTEHTHGDDCCSITDVTHTTHTLDCYNGTGSISVSKESVIFDYVIEILNNSKRAENGVVKHSSYYYIKIGDNWHRVSGLTDSNWNSARIETCATSNHTHGDGSCTYCSLPEHIHSEKCYDCNKPVHAHTSECKNSTVPYMEYVEADTDVIVRGDGSTIVNVYYEYKSYTIRFIYARSNTRGENVTIATSTGCGQYNNDHSSNVDHNGSNYGNGHQNVNWSTTVTALPEITDAHYNQNGNNGYFTEGTYRYYYIALTAKYGDNIESIWPDASIGSVSTSGGATYSFGSWGADCKSGYRGKDPEHANIVGPYPVMSSEMIVDPNNSIAQNMVAWWGASHDNIGTHAYHIYFEATSDTYDRIYEGKKYVLADTLVFTAAHNGNTRVDPFTYNGFVCVNDTREHGYNTTYDYQFNSSLYKKGSSQEDEEGHRLYDCPDNSCDYCNCFYYDRNTHQLSFYNYNEPLNDEGDDEVHFGKLLNEYKIPDSMMRYVPGADSYYPIGVEPGAYVFGGWYTTPEYLEGTEVDWEKDTMPNGDLTLYAKWTPVERTILFYSAYSDIQKDINDETDTVYHFMKAENVLHGSTLGSAYLSTPEFPGDLDITINGGDQAAEYDFVGWFYMDEDNKKKFAPDSMEVTRDLILFAEWQTGLDTEYEIQYVLKDAVSGTNTQDFNSYPAGYVIADTLSAHASVGQTKTFEAKSGSALYAPFAKHFFPLTNSHSILMEANPSANRYTFEYMYDDIVFYKIRYLEQGTNNVLHEEYQTYTSNAIISEKFKPINGYLPTSYYITRALQYDANATSAIEANTFTFYYVKDTVHGLYSVEYYIENIDSTDSNDPSNYSMLESIVGVGNLGSKLTVDVRSYTGFTHKPDMNTLITYEENGDEGEIITAESAFNNIIIEYTGVTVKVYYSRNEYSYTVKYVEYGKNALETIESATKYKYESIVTESAPNSIKNNGVDYFFYATDEKPQTQSLEIRNDEAQNEIVFYFKPRTYIVNYEVRCNTVGAVNFGMVTRNNSTGERIDQIQSATANALSSYEFIGWYDAAGTLITTAATYKPSGFGDDGKDGNIDGNITYYAYFAPIYTNLLVENKIADTTSDSFIFRVQGQGKLSYIDIYVAVQGDGEFNITNLPTGSYTVTKLSDWSWNYTAADVESKNIDTSTKISNSKIYITLDAKSGQTVTFTNEADSSNWLNGEASNENVFN